MSKLETPMVLRWWSESGLSGILAEESPLVAKSGLTQRRRADAVAVLDSSGRQAVVDWRELPALKGRDVVVVQAKASPLCAPLAGQAVGSAWLLHRHSPNSVRSVLLCTSDDADLRPLVEAHGVEVVVMPEFGGRPFAYPADGERLAIWGDRVGGVLRENFELTDGPRPHRAHAVHVDEAPTGRGSRTSLEGLDVQVLTSARSGSKGGTSFGMYTIGMALLHRELARKRGATSVTTKILTTTTDPTMADMCVDLGIEFEEV